jgi:hypothetical protein
MPKQRTDENIIKIPKQEGDGTFRLGAFGIR